MKNNDIKLGLVLIVALVLAGFVSTKLSKKHADMTKAQSLAYASRWPVAGFQKFLADVVWMRFLNFAGSHAPSDANINRYDWYFKKIIALDPDFYEAYRDGALFFGPIDIDRALWFVDAGRKHPRFSKTKSKLPLIGGQIIMRRESMKYYKGKQMDRRRLQQAQAYFAAAKEIPGHLPTALTNFIRTTVFLSDKEEPQPILELREWAAVLRKSRLESGGEDIGGYEGSMDSTKIEQRVIRQINKVAKSYIQESNADDPNCELAKKVVKNTIAKSFPNIHFDAETFKPYPKTAELAYRGTIENPELKKYVLELDADEYFAIQSIVVRAGEGSGKISVLINGKAVVGLDNLSVDNKKRRMPVLRKLELDKKEKAKMKLLMIDFSNILIPDPIYGNKGKNGGRIEIRVESMKGLKDLSYVLRAYKGNFF